MTSFERDEMEQNLKHSIKMEEALNQLEKDDNFKLLVDTYILKEPVRLTHLLADASLNMSDKATLHRKEIQESLIGIARFSAYLRHIHLLAARAKKELEELNKKEVED